MEDEGETKSCWKNFKETVVTAAKKVLPKKERETRRKWMTSEILELMKGRQETSDRKSQNIKDGIRRSRRDAEKQKRSGSTQNAKRSSNTDEQILQECTRKSNKLVDIDLQVLLGAHNLKTGTSSQRKRRH